MKKHWQHIIAMAMAAAALLPWRIMNKGSGSRSSDGGWYRINNAGTEDASQPLEIEICLLYTSPSPRDGLLSRMPSSA